MTDKTFLKFVLVCVFLLYGFGFAHAKTTNEKQSFSEQYKTYTKAIQGDENDAMLAARAEKLIAASAAEFGDTHINTINMTISTAHHFRNAREREQAANWYNHALDLFEQSDEKRDEKDKSTYMILLAEILKLNININVEEKISLTRTLKNALEDFFETTNPDETIFTSMDIYSIIVLKGLTSRRTKSLRTLGESIVEAAEQRLPADDSRLLKLQFNHAKLLKAADQRNDAIAYFHKVIANTNEQLNYSHPYALGAHAQLVELYESKGDSESATQHCIAIGKMTPWRDAVDPAPLYRENPVYPVNHARSNKEGWVLLGFDITPFGFVDKLKVLASDGGEDFEKAGINALETWRYAPKFENGTAVIASDMTVRLNFTLRN